MEHIAELVNIIKICVMAYGGWVSGQGLIAFGEAKSQGNGPGENAGLQKAFGGGIIIFVGVVLIPLVAGWLTV